MTRQQCGYVMQVQPFSVNDGEGIRTTVFLAGCPLRCKWCSNPEGLSAESLVGWYERKCIGCGACAEVCPQGIGINMNAVDESRSVLRNDEHASVPLLERDRCDACGKCVDACPVEARSRMVTLMDANEILEQIQKHRLFYSYSGGGVTFSGGEATSQLEFLDYLTREIYDMGISMDIETCGLFDWDNTAPILERMDLIFMDLKMMDPDKHRLYTGVSNERILENIAHLAELHGRSARTAVSASSKVNDVYSNFKIPAINDNRYESDPDIVIRIPVIGGVNDDEENVRSSAAYVHEHLPDARMELLPYHRYGMIKYEAAGIPYDHPEFTTPSPDKMQRLRALVRSEGVALADFR